MGIQSPDGKVQPRGETAPRQIRHEQPGSGALYPPKGGEGPRNGQPQQGWAAARGRDGNGRALRPTNHRRHGVLPCRSCLHERMKVIKASPRASLYGSGVLDVHGRALCLVAIHMLGPMALVAHDRP